MSQLQVTGEAKIRDIQGPVVANDGVITALDGAASQYVRGDGTLADFPTSTGGGSSVSYYLNSSVSQGTIGGVAYRELSKTPIIGAGTDISISSNGYVANYLTDANDPDLLEVPGGNFNCEFYFSVNNNTGNPFTYAELYKYDGTTFTLLGSSVGVPEYITQGTTIAPYYFAIPVATAALALTDRLAIRIYVNVDGRTVTLHTENSHLCQVVTTFSKGMVSLNNLTDQSQYLTTGTSGTNFNIVSSGDTHTFNLPVASAANTGKLSSTDWSTFNGKVPYTGATANVDLGNFNFDANEISGGAIIAKLNGPASSPFVLKSGSSGYVIGDDAISLISSPNVANTLILASNIGVVTKTALIGLGSLTATRTFTLPDLSGTLALLEGSQTYTGFKTFSDGLRGSVIASTSGLVLSNTTQVTASSGEISICGSTTGLLIRTSTYVNVLDFPTSSYTYTFPASSGTIALTSNLSSYVPYTGATGSVNLGAFDITSRFLFSNGSGTAAGLVSMKIGNTITGVSGYGTFGAASGQQFVFNSFVSGSYNKTAYFNFSGLTDDAVRSFTFPNADGTLALTSDLGAYVTLATTQTISGAKTFLSDIIVTGVRVGKGSGSLSGNTALGEFSLNSNTTGNQNTGIGFGGLFSNTTGQQNTALGNVAMNTNTTGNNNTAIGFSTLISNSTGSNNTVIGSSAGSSITTGSNNTIIGCYSGTPSLANNIVLADGQGNIRYQWNGTNNVFTNPISATTALFNGSVDVLNGQINLSNSYYLTARNNANNTFLALIGRNPSDKVVIDPDGYGTILGGALSGTSATFSGALTVNGLINNTYSDNAFLGLLIRNTNTGNSALSGFSIQNSGGTTVGQVNYVSTVYANTTLRNTLLINTVFDNKLAFVTNSSGGATRADIYFSVNPAFALDATNPNQIHILGTSRNVAINYSGTDYGQKFQVNGSSYFGDVATFSSSVTALGQISSSISSNSGSGSSYPLNRISNTLATQGDGSSTFNFAGLLVESGNGAVQFYHSTSYAAGTWEPQALLNVATNHPLIIRTNNTERMRITSGGDVAIGTTAALLTASGRGNLTINGSSTSVLTFGIAGAYSGYIYSSSSILELDAQGSRNMGFNTNGQIRMTITSGGKLLVRTTTSTAGGGGDRVIELDGNIYSKGTDAGYFWTDRSNASNFYGWYTTSNTVFLFNGTANAAQINPSTGNYTALSDINKKKDFEDSKIGLNAILSLKPTLYRMKSDANDSEKHLGFIAQEVKEFIPQAYVESGEEDDKFIGLNFNAITASNTKAIQELYELVINQQTQIEELKALIAAK